MAQNSVLSRFTLSLSQGFVPAVLASATLALLPLQLVSEAQEQAPAAPATAPGGRGGGRGLAGGRGFGPTMKPSALRAIPAETTAAKVKDPNWRAPRTAWGHPDLEGVWTSDDMRGIPLASRIKQYMGDARARWDGDTLVVETTNFTDKTSFSGLHSDQLKLTERFTRIDPEMIDYRIRVEDPATWTAPFTVRLTITQQPGYQLYEYSCHEGNGAVSYALSGERAYERMVADAKAKGLPIPPRTMGMEVYSGAPVEGRQPVREFGGGKE